MAAAVTGMTMVTPVTAVTAVTAVWKIPFERAGGGAGARDVLLHNAQSGEGKGGSEDSGQKQWGRTERGQNNE